MEKGQKCQEYARYIPAPPRVGGRRKRASGAKLGFLYTHIDEAAERFHFPLPSSASREVTCLGSWVNSCSPQTEHRTRHTMTRWAQQGRNLTSYLCLLLCSGAGQMDSPSISEKQELPLTLTSVPGRPACPSSTERLYPKKETHSSWWRNAQDWTMWGDNWYVPKYFKICFGSQVKEDAEWWNHVGSLLELGWWFHWNSLFSLLLWPFENMHN